MSDEITSLIEHCPEDETMAKYILDRLLFHYPNHTWIVQAFTKQGYATIRNPSISYKMGMRMIFPKILTHGDLEHKILIFGGEFLERFDIRRAKADRDETQDRWKTARFR